VEVKSPETGKKIPILTYSELQMASVEIQYLAP
jgi:hypothetical protein